MILSTLPMLLYFFASGAFGHSKPLSCLSGVNEVTIAGPDKSASASAIAGVLTRINYPTGGYKEFLYELNHEMGGLKIDKITHVDENDEVVSENDYEFTDPVHVAEPNLYTADSEKISLYSGAANLVFDFNDIGGFRKSTVTDLKTNIISEQYYYVPDFTDDNYKVTKRFRQIELSGDDVQTIKQVEELSVPYSSFPYFDPTIGLLKSSTLKTDSETMQTKVYNYSYEAIQGGESKFTQTTIQFLDDHIDYDGGFFDSRQWHWYQFLVAIYDIKIRSLTLDSVVQTDYEDGEAIVTTTNYTYDNAYKTLPIATETRRSSGDPSLDVVTRSTILYPFDDEVAMSVFPLDDRYQELVDDHAIGIPVQTVSEVQYPSYGANTWKTTGVSLTTYDLFNGITLPKHTYTLPIDAPLASWSESSLELATSLDYDADGYLLSNVGRDGVKTIYDYDDYGYIESVTIDPGAAGMQRTTNYVNKPLVGIERVTDPNGRMIQYEYDGRNRLQLVRELDLDQNSNVVDGDILKRYRYHSLSDDNFSTSLGRFRSW